MESKTEQFLEALEASNKLDEINLGDVAHKVGNAVKGFFGTSKGAAQRANADIQSQAATAQQTAQATQDMAAANAAKADADIANFNPQEGAQQIVDLLNKALKKQLKANNKDVKAAEKQKNAQAVSAKMSGSTETPKEEKPANNGATEESK